MPIALQWTDDSGVVHACESCIAAPGIRLVWTRCEIDVPPNGSHYCDNPRDVTCEACLTRPEKVA
jgi:hypothetical protein